MQEEVVVNFRGEEITLRVPQGTTDDQIRVYLESQGSQQQPRETSAMGAAGAFATNLSNSLMFGAPEMINRAINPGAGAYYDQMRQDYPRASTAGDVAGMINPVRLGMKAGSNLVEAAGRRMAPETVQSAGQQALESAVQKNMQAYSQAMQRFDFQTARANLPNASPAAIKAAQTARTDLNKLATDLAKVEKAAQKNAAGGVVRQGVRTGVKAFGGITGLQTGAGMLGAARTPESPSAGFQQGANMAGQAVQQFGLPFVPGMSQITGGLTQAVPAAGMGVSSVYNSAIDQYVETERRIRDEAARRAMQGQQ